MTVSSSTRRAGPFNGNDVTVAFPFTFKVFAAADVAVYLTDADGAQSLLSTNYSVTLNGDQDASPGGTINYPTVGDPLPEGSRLDVVGSVANTQGTDLTNLGRFQPNVIERALDKITILIQQVAELLARSIRMPVGDTASTTLPTATARAGKVLVFDDDGNVDVGEDDFADLAGAASASAAAAAGSAASAADSAAVAGAAAVGNFLQAGAGAVARTYSDKVRERVSFFDFFTAAQQADALSGAPALDHTAAMQAAIDAAPAGAVVEGRSNATFKFTHLLTSKALTLDFKGAALIVDPTPVGVTTGTPAIRFAGTRGVGYAINTKAAISNDVTCTTAGDSANFADGDWVVIDDETVVDKWDASGTGYGGRGQIARVKSQAAGVITLNQPVEHLYQGATAKIYKVTPVVSPRVQNIGSLTEVDPGGITTGSVELNAPHLIEFAYCIRPKVSAVAAAGFNLFVVHFGYCVQPSIKRVSAMDAFRPTNGGHGYLMRFYRCAGGVAKLNRGERIRHVVDFTNTYDCLSESNIGVDNANSSFSWHGLASRRCRSIGDTVVDETTFANASAGWAVGNPSFNADYKSAIINPVYRGAGGGIIVTSLCDSVDIIAPDIGVADASSAGRGVIVQGGAKNVRISGGLIDMSGTAAQNCNAVLSRDLSGIATGDVVISGTRMVAPTGGGNPVACTATAGGFAVNNCVIHGDGAYEGIIVSAAATWLQITGNVFTGTHSRAVRVTTAPTTAYVVTENIDAGTIAQFLQLAVGANLLEFGNGRTGQVFSVNGAAGTARQIELRTAAVVRWILRGSATAEGGANAGTDFEISRRADDGSNLGTTLAIVRSSGQMNLEAGGSWDKPLKLGTNFLWFDSTGKLRCKGSTPTTDLDGAVVGTQT